MNADIEALRDACVDGCAADRRRLAAAVGFADAGVDEFGRCGGWGRARSSWARLTTSRETPRGSSRHHRVTCSEIRWWRIGARRGVSVLRIPVVLQRMLLVEDEPPARRYLRRLLLDACPTLQISAAEDVEQAVFLLERNSFDAVFLDVHLPGRSGLVLGELLQSGPPVVFVTAHRDYAVEAFELSAVDYLVKPVDPARLARALKRLEAVESSPVHALQVAPGAVRFVSEAQIVCVLGQGDYTEVWLDDGTSELVEVPMYAWEARLSEAFSRVHRSSLVRIEAIVRLDRSARGTYSLQLPRVARPVKVSRAAARMIRERIRPGSGEAAR
ncbi:MAG: LytTR family DNA-binding domain-containing protein [Myxococcota bacterium]